jgi:hypothetical protein
MATLEDLKTAAKEAEVVDEFEGDHPELEQARDMEEAISLLNKSMHLMAVLSDTDLCKSVSKRERNVLSHMSDQIRLFLDEVSDYYGDGEES